jgi:hypothetical protein
LEPIIIVRVDDETTTIKVLYYKYSECREREEREKILIMMKRVNYLMDEENKEIEERKRFSIQ